jgi:Cofilin/tropomyosin-type actin-binding protein
MPLRSLRFPIRDKRWAEEQDHILHLVCSPETFSPSPTHHDGAGLDRVMIRSPDVAKIKNKMLFSTSKDALRRALVGVATEIQGTDPDEISYETGGSSATLSAHPQISCLSTLFLDSVG